MSNSRASPAGFSEYYVAVGTQSAKLTTLLELLVALIQEQTSISILVCCGSRDSVDAVVHSISLLKRFSVWALHSDLTAKELDLQVLGFKQAASAGAATSSPAAPRVQGSQTAPQGTGDGSTAQAPEALPQPAVLVATDSSLRALSRESTPLGVQAIIQYDLPSNKEVYSRRVTVAFGGSKERRGAGRSPQIVVYFVVAGLLGTFREVEGFSLSPIQEMPVQVNDMFLAGAA